MTSELANKPGIRQRALVAFRTATDRQDRNRYKTLHEAADFLGVTVDHAHALLHGCQSELIDGLYRWRIGDLENIKDTT